MSFFLTEEQEETINIILDEENTKVCEEQLNSEDFPEELKEIIRKTVEAGAPIPAFDPQVGYYTVSFTPCEQGNRIYIHHHLSGVSRAIYDPLQVNTIEEESTPEVSPTEVLEDEEFYMEPPKSNFIEPNAFRADGPPEMDFNQIESSFGRPPQEVLDEFKAPIALENQ